jgi:hypothetical protein
MDGAGLIAVAVAIALGAAACSDAAADRPAPTPAPAPAPAAASAVFDHLRITPPAGWVRMPAVEDAAAQAAAKMPSAVTSVEAWGDPGAGCYAVAVDARGVNAESIARSVERLAAGLKSLGVDAKALPKPVDETIDAPLPIKTGELTGTARVRVFRGADKHPQAVALACAGNAREPERCTSQCQALLLQMAPPVGPP